MTWPWPFNIPFTHYHLCRYVGRIMCEFQVVGSYRIEEPQKPPEWKPAFFTFDLTLTWPVTFLENFMSALEAFWWDLSNAASTVSLWPSVLEIAVAETPPSPSPHSSAQTTETPQREYLKILFLRRLKNRGRNRGTFQFFFVGITLTDRSTRPS